MSKRVDIRNTLTILFSIAVFTLPAQPKAGEPGSKGTFMSQGYSTTFPDKPGERQYELWYEGVKVMTGKFVDEKKNGPWRYTNLDNSVFYQGLYKDDQQNGAWKFYVNQKLKCIAYFKNGSRDSTWQSFYPDGKIMAVVSFSKGLQNGSHKIYYNNETPAVTSTYSNDSILGDYITYYYNGAVKSKVFYRNGLPYTVIEMKDSLGNVLDAGSFKDGNGLLKMYNRKGQKIWEKNYLNGILDGKATTYEEGKVESEGTFKNGKQVGKWTYYNKNSMESYTREYAQDTLPKEEKKFVSPVMDYLNLEETMPEAPGKEKGMMDFIRTNITYPQMEKEAQIMGTVFVTFVVNADGTLSDIKILRGVNGGPGCDKEALRVINMFPPWTPGFQNGLPVRVQFNLPIKFWLR